MPARSAFVLYVDADERVTAGDRAALDPLLDDASVVACTVRFRPRPGLTRYRECRIFRNHPRMSCSSTINEAMLPALRDVDARDGLRIAPSEVAIDHVGGDGDQQARHEAVLRLLRARLAAEPTRASTWYHLGQTLEGLGDRPGALAAWRRAVSVARHRMPASALDRAAWVELLRHLPSDAPEFRGLLAEARARYPGDHTLAWIGGRALMAEGRYDEAIPIFERLLDIEASELCEDHVAHDARIFGELPHESLGLCHFRLGRNEEGARHYARAAMARYPATSERKSSYLPAGERSIRST